MSDDDISSLGFLISDAARLMRTVFDRRVGRLGLTRAQWLVLGRLHRRPGASQSELAEMMEVEKASAGRMVDRLERKGWVVRKADEGDRRINRLYLTPEAEKIRKRMWTVAEQTLEDAVSDLPGQDVERLMELLGTVKGRLTVLASSQEAGQRGARTRVNGKARHRHNGGAADATSVAVRGSDR